MKQYSYSSNKRLHYSSENTPFDATYDLLFYQFPSGTNFSTPFPTALYSDNKDNSSWSQHKNSLQE